MSSKPNPATNRLDIDPSQTVFPHKCLQCGAPPTTTYNLRSDGGYDFMIAREFPRTYLPVPLCTPCGHRKTWGRLAWSLLVLGTIPGVWFPLVLAMALAKPLTENESTAATVIALLLIPVTLCLIWWFRNREDRLYHRWFSPVWIDTIIKSWRIAQFGFRNDRSRLEVGVLSGALDPNVFAVEAGFRGNPAPAPIPFSPQPKRIPRWLPLAFLAAAVGCVALGFCIYDDLNAAEHGHREIRLHVLLILLYEIGGKTLVAGFLGSLSLPCLVGAAAAIRAVAKDRGVWPRPSNRRRSNRRRLRPPT